MTTSELLDTVTDTYALNGEECPEADHCPETFDDNRNEQFSSRDEDSCDSATETPPSARRPMQVRRFLLGLMLSAGGMGLMLFVAAGALQAAGANGALSLPTVALAMIIGLMLLGGGFGIMATSAPGLDDGEFERLMSEHPESGSPADLCRRKLSETISRQR
ncbi:MAG: hypothetical protein R3C49_15570 [Planctomycetaceae bacterium]